jgi:hypothetical protein
MNIDSVFVAEPFQVMRVSTVSHYRASLLPAAVIGSVQAYDERSAQMLENLAIEWRSRRREEELCLRTVSHCWPALESCRADESRLLLSEHRATFFPLLRRAAHRSRTSYLRDGVVW